MTMAPESLEDDVVDIQIENIFGIFQVMFNEGLYQKADELLDSYYRVAHTFEVEVLVALLVATAQAKLGLQNRRKIYLLAEERLRDDEEKQDSLLGLE